MLWGIQTDRSTRLNVNHVAILQHSSKLNDSGLGFHTLEGPHIPKSLHALSVMYSLGMQSLRVWVNSSKWSAWKPSARQLLARSLVHSLLQSHAATLTYAQPVICSSRVQPDSARCATTMQVPPLHLQSSEGTSIPPCNIEPIQVSLCRHTFMEVKYSAASSTT